MVSEEAIGAVVKSLVSHKDYICMGSLENALEHLFSPEERDGRCPSGLHEAMSIAEGVLKDMGYKPTPRMEGYEKAA